jgi:hypothetical protein
MNRHLVDRLVSALLYEGYLLYPYRPSVKNRQRWSFGGLYPPSYTEGRVGSDSSVMQTQCLLRGGDSARLTVSVRFLHLIAREVGAIDPASTDWPLDESTPIRFVESLRVGEDTIHSWQEAVEREISLDESDVSELVSCFRRVEFEFGPGAEREPLRDTSGVVIGIIERRQRHMAGTVDLSAENVGDGVFRISVRIENRTPFEIERSDDRDEVLLHALVSTHTTLGVRDGSFVSLFDPPESLRAIATGCQNVGAWPVLVGADGETDTILSSPIILYDYPQIAPQSPGDLFDSTEIDEILSLRIMTLTDDEKRTMSALDKRGCALLERTESLAHGQLMGLHGTMREVRPLHEGGPR